MSECDVEATADLDLTSASEEMDLVYSMLQRLQSSDTAESLAARKEVDAYLVDKEHKRLEAEAKSKARADEVEGCKTVRQRTVVNNQKSKDEEILHKISISEDLKCSGNEFFRAGDYSKAAEFFRAGDYSKAAEFYTSALLQHDNNAVVFVNRAQAYLKLGKNLEAVHDCKQAIKINPAAVKAYVHLSKAHTALCEFQQALDVLQQAEDMANDNVEVIRGYRADTIKAMKEHMLNNSEILKQEQDK